MLVKNRWGILWNLSEQEAKKRIEKDGWTIVIEKKEETIEDLKEKYCAKYSKDVPNCKKNNMDWIKGKL